MSNCFHCKLCDKLITIKSINKHLKSRRNQLLAKCIISGYYISNPDFLKKEDIIKKHVCDYYKTFREYLVICKCKLIFDVLTYNFKSKKLYNTHRYYCLRQKLITKIDYLARYGHKFSHISDMIFTFVTTQTNMTYENYLKQPKPMLEWKLNEKLARIPELKKAFDISSHPLIRKYYNERGDQDSE